MYLKQSFSTDPVLQTDPILYRKKSAFSAFPQNLLPFNFKIIFNNVHQDCHQTIVVKLAVGSHCCHWQLKSHCQLSLLPTASRKQSLLLLPTVTAVCKHARACMCAEVYMYHSTGKLCTCMPFYNVLTKKRNPLEGKSGLSLLQQWPLWTRACVRARACMRTEVYIYHSTGTICTCMSLYNDLTQNNPLRRQQLLFLRSTISIQNGW